MMKTFMLSASILMLSAFAAFAVVSGPQLVPDYNRDGKIDAADYGRLEKGETFTIWLNDDDDADGFENDDNGKGDTNNDLHDVPGGEGNDLDCEDGQVNGRCDLLDFFPVLINVEVVPGWDTMTWKLSSKSVNVVFTQLKADTAGDFHTKEAKALDDETPLYKAEVSKLAEGDATLPNGFLKSGKGVIMVEGAALGDEGLTLRGEGGDGAEVTLDLRVKDVEKMYGWMNLRPQTAVSSKPPYQPPAVSQSSQRHFILVHGYNTNHEEARGNAAEFYKKLWQSGSDAMFTAVEWRGDQSQFEIFGLTVTPNYFVNVENAFLAARPFADACKKLTGEKILVGHSLGNVLISSAIKDYGLDYTKFVMLNAAVPREAFDASAYDEDMVDDDWLDTNKRPLLDRASHWYKNFAGKEYDPYEYRRKLAWRGRFANLPRTVNYYSPTDNILLNPDPHEPDPDKYDETEVWIAYLNRLGVRTPERPNQKTGFGFWSFSEKMKGTWVVDAISAFLAESDAMKREAGWGENGEYVEGKSFDPANTRFKPFLNERMKTRGMLDILPAETERLRAQHLADAIPAESFAAGANEVTTLENVNMEGFIGENRDWPVFEGEEVHTNEWKHSTFREVAFYHTSALYTSLAAVGKPRVIIDTDLGSSMDDLFAVDLAARMHKAGKLDLMAVMMDRPDYSDNEHKGEFLAFADRYLASLGLGDLPIGKSTDQTKQGQPVFNPYWTLIYSNNLTGAGLLLPTNRTPDQINNSLTNAVALYRRLLRKAPDKSVVICSTGFLTNLEELMKSTDDEVGEMPGTDLIAAKVKELRIMGGCFDYSVAPDGTGGAEYNFAGDPVAAKKVVEEWPTPVILSTWEVGLKLEYQPEDVLADFPAGTFDPAIRSAYTYWPRPLRDGDRNCLWDPMTVLPLTEGETLVPLSSNGVITVDEKGKTTFAPQVNGTRRYQMSSNMNATAVMNRYRAICRTGNPSVSVAPISEANPGVDYNGSVLSVKIDGFDLGSAYRSYTKEDLFATLTVAGETYEDPVWTDYDGLSGVLTLEFTVPDDKVTAGHAYEGVVKVGFRNKTLGENVVYTRKRQFFVQGRHEKAGPKTGWFHETDLEMPTNYVPETAMPVQCLATVETTVLFTGQTFTVEYQSPSNAVQGAVRIVKDGKGGYKFQYYACVGKTNEDFFVRGWWDFNFSGEGAEEIKPELGTSYTIFAQAYYLEDARREENTLVISVRKGDNGLFFKQFIGNIINAKGGQGGTTRLNSVEFLGDGTVSSLVGNYYTNTVNATLAKIDGDKEYATVAEAVAVANGQDVRLLHKASWKPTAADLGKPVKLLNKGRLVLDDSELPPGSAVSWSDVDGNNGTLTLLPLGAEKNPWLVGTTNRADVVAWTNGTDCLVIEGRGAMMDFEAVGPWGMGIAAVDFGAQVTNFGVNAFAGCTLTDLTMRGNPPAIGAGNDFSDVTKIVVREDALQKFKADPVWNAYVAKFESVPVCYDYKNVKTLSPFLHEIRFKEEYDSPVDGPYAVEPEILPAFSCTAVRNGNFYGRNFDYYLSDISSFVVRMPARHDSDPKKNRLASVGVAAQDPIREDGVTNGQYTASYDTLPEVMYDGINECGVIMNVNVVPRYDCGELTGTNPGADDLHVAYLIRYVLDHATNAMHAIELANSRNLVGNGGPDYLLHWMVADPEDTYVVEIVTNKVVARKMNIISNFNWNWDNANKCAVDDAYAAAHEGWGRDDYPVPYSNDVSLATIDKYYTPHSDGLERFCVVREHYDEGATFDGMSNLLRRVQYTRMADTNNWPIWLSDFTVDPKMSIPKDVTNRYDRFRSNDPELMTFLTNKMSRSQDVFAHKEENRKLGLDEWQTVHNTTYDISKRMFRIAVQEDYAHAFDIYLVESVPVAPGEPIGPFDTAEEASNVLKKAVFTPSAEVAAKLGEDALRTYCNMFTLDVVPFGESQWAVEAFLLPPEWTNVVESAQEATLQLPIADIAAWQSGDDPIPVHLTNCVPGFYYSLYDGAVVTDLTADIREVNCNVLCGAEKTVDLPEVTPPPGCTTSGFFFIGVLEAPLPFIPGSTDSRTNRYTGPKKPVRQH